MVTTNALDLVTKSKGKTDSNKNIAVSINKTKFFIDKEPVSETELESNYFRFYCRQIKSYHFKGRRRCTY
jgi:biopolymer transport protein ExbD